MVMALGRRLDLCPARGVCAANRPGTGHQWADTGAVDVVLLEPVSGRLDDSPRVACWCLPPYRGIRTAGHAGNQICWLATPR